MKALHVVAFLLTIVGGLNWGLVGIGGLTESDLNVVHMLLGTMPMVESAVYVLVGLSAVYLVLGHKKDCKMCSGGM